MNPREKALKTNRIASLVEIAIGAVLLGIVAIFGSKMSSILYLLVGFVGLVIFLTGVLWGTMIRSRVKKCYCKNCGEKYNYQNDVAWEVTDEIASDKAITDVVEFTCSCSHCGDEFHFTRKFRVAYYDDKGNIHRHDIHSLVNKFFKSY